MIFLNHLKRATQGLRALITDEMKLAVHYDEDYHYRSNVFFNIIPQQSEVLERLAGKDRIMRYELGCKLYYRKAGYKPHTHLDPINELSERFVKLFSNNPQPESADGVNWNDYNTDWNSAVDYINLLTAYIGHNFFIDGIDYDPTRTDKENVTDLHIVEYDLSFNLLDGIPAT